MLICEITYWESEREGGSVLSRSREAGREREETWLGGWVSQEVRIDC